MKKKELLKKEELAEQLGMKFEEASDLFSNETLETMRMVNVIGGSGVEDVTNNCYGGNCIEGCGGVTFEDDCGKVKYSDCGVCTSKAANCDKCTAPSPEPPETTDPTDPGTTIDPGATTTDPTTTIP